MSASIQSNIMANSLFQDLRQSSGSNIAHFQAVQSVEIFAPKPSGHYAPPGSPIHAGPARVPSVDASSFSNQELAAIVFMARLMRGVHRADRIARVLYAVLGKNRSAPEVRAKLRSLFRLHGVLNCSAPVPWDHCGAPRGHVERFRLFVRLFGKYLHSAVQVEDVDTAFPIQDVMSICAPFFSAGVLKDIVSLCPNFGIRPKTA